MNLRLNDPRFRRPMPPTAYGLPRLGLQIFRVLGWLAGMLTGIVLLAGPLGFFIYDNRNSAVAMLGIGLVLVLCFFFIVVVECVVGLGRAVFDMADYAAAPSPDHSKPSKAATTAESVLRHMAGIPDEVAQVSQVKAPVVTHPMPAVSREEQLLAQIREEELIKMNSISGKK